MAGEHTELPHAFLGKPYRLQELSEIIYCAMVNNRRVLGLKTKET